MTRAEIGSYLGLKLETVSRVLSRFSHDNLIIVNQKHVQIMDFEGLRAIVSGQAYSHENPGLHRIEPVAHRGVNDLVGLEDRRRAELADSAKALLHAVGNLVQGHERQMFVWILSQKFQAGRKS